MNEKQERRFNQLLDIVCADKPLSRREQAEYERLCDAYNEDERQAWHALGLSSHV